MIHLLGFLEEVKSPESVLAQPVGATERASCMEATGTHCSWERLQGKP